MHLLLMLWLAVCAASAVLCLRSIWALRAGSLLTSLGWIATLVYFAIAAASSARGVPAPVHSDYIALGVMVVAFVVAGARKEPQAEPWWWPRK